MQMKILKDYIELFERNALECRASADMNIPVRYISCDSQDVKESTLFICKGAHFKEKYLLDALSRERFAILLKRGMRRTRRA